MKYFKHVLWLSDIADSSLLQGLELAEMVAQLRLDQASVLAAICYHAWRKSLVDKPNSDLELAMKCAS